MSLSMDKNKFEKMKKAFEANGGVIDSSPDIDRHLDYLGADAAALNKDTIIIKHDVIPSASAMFEELIHTAQYKSGKAKGNNWIDMEIKAKKKLIKYQKQYGITDVENEITKMQLNELLKIREEGKYV